MVMFAFRMVMIARVGDQVYGDEQEQFVCNTDTPGCNQVTNLLLMSRCYVCLGVLQQVRANLAFEILVGDGDHNSHPTDRVSSVRNKFNHEK